MVRWGWRMFPEKEKSRKEKINDNMRKSTVKNVNQLVDLHLLGMGFNEMNTDFSNQLSILQSQHE